MEAITDPRGVIGLWQTERWEPSMPRSGFSRAFVVGAYIPNGGTYMAYHLGRILQRDFDIEAFSVIVAGESVDNGVQSYDLRMPTVEISDLEATITDDDILIVNPSFSNHLFGWKLRGFKVSYVQGFSTYTLLDQRFDRYVAVSGFVQQFLRNVYAIEAPVIPAFIQIEKIPPTTPWLNRPALSVLPYRKGIPEIWDVSYETLRRLLRGRATDVIFENSLFGGHYIPQPQLFEAIGRSRYVLMLSAAEGLPLVPLEAMAMGTIVLGYDGYGGRDYLLPGINCAVVSYPAIEQLADQIVGLLSEPERGCAISKCAVETAKRYSYEAFRERWIQEFTTIVGSCPTRLTGSPADPPRLSH